MDITRFLPNNQYEAALNANAPTALNPFATIADIVNIYNNDGILSNSRTVSGNGNSLSFIDLDEFNITSENVVEIFSTDDSVHLAGNGLLLESISNSGNVVVSTTTGGAFIVPNSNNPDIDVTIPSNGMIKYSNSANEFRFYQNGAWRTFSTGGGSADGNGIYDGSGTIPTSTISTITDSFQLGSGLNTFISDGTVNLSSNGGITTMGDSFNSFTHNNAIATLYTFFGGQTAFHANRNGKGIAMIASGASEYQDIAATNGLAFFTNWNNDPTSVSATEAMRIGNTQNVAIGGTNVFSQRFLVVGSGNTDSTTLFRLQNSLNTDLHIFKDGGATELTRNGAITTIGSPTTNYLKQEVQESQQFSSTATYTGFNANRNGNKIALRANSSTIGSIDTTGSMIFRTNWDGDFNNTFGTIAMTIDTSQRIAIGTSATSGQRFLIRGTGNTFSTINTRWTNASNQDLAYIDDEGNQFFNVQGGYTRAGNAFNYSLRGLTENRIVALSGGTSAPTFLGFVSQNDSISNGVHTAIRSNKFGKSQIDFTTNLEFRGSWNGGATSEGSDLVMNLTSSRIYAYKDIEFSNDTLGIIHVDVTTGDKYKIEINNGVIGLVLVP